MSVMTWSVGIFCVVLLFGKSCALPTTTAAAENKGTLPLIANAATAAKTPTTDDSYDVIDMVNQKSNPHQSTGQTTRITTTGELDDAFWLKHLGDDFKYAIHLQVAGDDLSPHRAYNGSSNKAVQNAAMKANFNSQMPVVTTKNVEEATYVISETKEKPADVLSTKPREYHFNAAATQVANKTYNNAEEAKIAYKQQSDAIARTASKNKNQKLSKEHAINSKHAIKDMKRKQHQKTKSNKQTSHSDAYSPVVVTLPETRSEALQINEDEVPVVVKMPPIIYHRKANYASDRRQEQNAKTEAEAKNNMQTQHIQAQQQTNLHSQTNSQDNPTYATTTYQQNTQSQQQQKQIDASQQTQTQYTNTDTHLQQQQPQQPTTQHFTPYTTQTFYTNANTNSNTQPIDLSSYSNSNSQVYQNTAAQILKENAETPSQSDIRYILRKPNGSGGYTSYPGSSAYLPMESQYEGYRRVSRSAKQLFCQGL